MARTRTGRTKEDQDLFYGQRNEIFNALTDVKVFDRRTQEEENEKAMAALKIKLEDCESLIGTCGHLAGLVMRQEAARMGPDKDAPKRSVDLRDIRILGAALWELKKAAEAKAPKEEGRPAQTKEIIKLGRALARVSPVPLVYAAYYGEEFPYRIKEESRTGVPITMHRKRYFGGIPEDKRPVKLTPVTRDDNMTEMTGKVDYGIYPENMKRVYGVLTLLEKEQPIVELGADPKNKDVVGRRVNRAGEADFFWAHLPKGLKEPRAETK